MKNSKQILLSVLGVAILIVAVVGVSFAAFTYAKLGEQVNTLTTGAITMVYTEGTSFTIDNAMPTDDATGKISDDKFDFSVNATITGAATINYDIAAVKDADCTLRDQDVVLHLTEDTTGSEVEKFAPSAFTGIATASANGAPEGSMVLLTDNFTTTTGLTETRKYIFRMWVSKDIPADQMEISRTYKVRIGVYGKQA